MAKKLFQYYWSKNTNYNEHMFITICIFVINNYFVSMEEQIRKSETSQFKAIFPNTLNANNTLFGGQAMQWMDEVAYNNKTYLTSFF